MPAHPGHHHVPAPKLCRAVPGLEVPLHGHTLLFTAYRGSNQLDTHAASVSVRCQVFLQPAPDRRLIS
jgi:hypothetical protein